MKINLILLLSTLLFLSSCGSVRVFVNEEHTYSKKNPITINLSTNDKSGALGELQFLLKSNGYKLMSYGSAKKSLNLDSQYNISSTHNEITYTKEFNSIYLMDIDFTYHNNDVYYYRTFTATITDLRTGEIIMTANFRGYKLCKFVLQEFVNELNKIIK